MKPWKAFKTHSYEKKYHHFSSGHFPLFKSLSHKTFFFASLTLAAKRKLFPSKSPCFIVPLIFLVERGGGEKIEARNYPGVSFSTQPIEGKSITGRCLVIKTATDFIFQSVKKCIIPLKRDSTKSHFLGRGPKHSLALTRALLCWKKSLIIGCFYEPLMLAATSDRGWH